MQKLLAIKIGVIFVIAVLILIPVSMVKSKIVERLSWLTEAKHSVTSSWTGPQQIMTPVLVIPYTQHLVRSDSGHYYSAAERSQPSYRYIMPEKSRLESAVQNKSLRKGIYEIPVYVSNLQISASFSANRLQEELARLKQDPGVEEVHTPHIALYVSDVRGIDSSPTLTVNDQQLTIEPGSGLPHLSGGLHAELARSEFTEGDLEVSVSLALRGTESLGFLPLGDYSEFLIESDWPHPEFFGASLPRDRSISDQGFTAHWLSTRFTNTNEEQFATCTSTGVCQTLQAGDSGVRFIEAVDIYLQAERSVKYAMLFVGLSFVSFFVFETLKQVRIHPIQYTLVGLVIATFYLLLISLAEHIAFATAYGIAVICCCALLLFYVRYMFRSTVAAILFSAMTAGLYGLLYVIVQAEDYALLMGSMLVFAILMVVMFITRHVDWYELGR